MQDSEKFLHRLKEARGATPQGVFAKKLGISQVSLSRFEAGKFEPNLDTICRICKTAGISADYLLGLSDDAHSGSVITAPNNRGTIAQHSSIGSDCENCAKLMKLQAQLDILKEVMKK